jgi:hypothetical protein
MNLFKQGSLLFNSVHFVKHVKSRARLLQSASLNVKEDNRDREALFLDSRVQNILSSITGFDESKIFSPKPISSYRAPKYMFLTDEELKIVSNLYIYVLSFKQFEFVFCFFLFNWS